MVKIRKNDNVKVLVGKDKGKVGKVLKVLSTDNRVLVEGINFATVHKKPTSQSPGQILKEERPIHISNVAYLDGAKPVKIGYKITDGKKIRIARKDKNEIG
jgi:large subunit ribosomal protein L24